MKRVVVLGCGPAGLLAAHAASLQGADVQIFSRRQKSFIGGAQFLHEPIPGLTNSTDGWVTIIKSGTAGEYAEKVYGDSKMSVSWDLWTSGESKPAYSMHKIYEQLWGMYQDGIRDYEIITPDDLYELELIGADLYITSVPLPAICEKTHIFESVQMYIMDGFLPGIVVPENTIIYNGHIHMPWTRASNLFGFKSMEFARPLQTRAHRMIPGMKPTAHTCDCHPNWMRVGRFGQWRRGVLVHHAFKEVTHAMHQLQ